jgi:homoserine O-succinyltransferase/O-acetyltransferase
MSLQFDKHRLIASPTLAPGELGEAGQTGDRRNADTVVTIGLVNNMPDAALQATERQFIDLLKAAAGNRTVNLHCFSLPSVKRSQAMQSRVERLYTPTADLDHLQIDGLIVTGAEPRAARLEQEPFWRELTDVVDWAEANTRSTIWSCLAAHAAVLHLDGIERRRLDAKCSGVYPCFKAADDWLTGDIPSPFKVPHSRLNEIGKRDLIAGGYQVLTESADAGVDIFARQMRSRFIFFQGHPEYGPLSLQREYFRDISRFLAGEQDSYPAMPSGYFDRDTERRLAGFQARAVVERNPALSAELPAIALRPDINGRAAPAAIFRNWLGFLSGETGSMSPPTAPLS